MDVIIAARLSQKAKGRAQTGIMSQDEDAREWAQDEGHNVIETIPDHASGTKAMWEREHLKPWVTDPELMAKYQGIVAAKQDRLSRADWSGEKKLREWAEEHGKTLFIVDKNIRWPPRKDPKYYDDDFAAWNRGSEGAHREWNNTSRRYARMHKAKRTNNELAGRPPYGFRVAGIACGEIPCRCWEKEVEDGKKLVIYEPEAKVIREAKERFLNGESTRAICADFDARGIPSPTWKGKPGTHWRDTTLGRILRNPATAGRRMDNFDKGLRDESQRKTILTYQGIITWQEHGELVARLDDRAYRKGRSPFNVTLLTGIIFDSAGHPMYRMQAKHSSPRYQCRRGCGVGILMDKADDEVTQVITDIYGELPHLVRRIVPGKNHFEEIAKLRQDRNELDDLADDYAERNTAITAEIRRLAKLDKDNPQPDELKWVPSGQTVAQYWESLSVPARRDWLIENGWKVYVSKRDGGSVLTTIDAGYMAESAARQMNTLGIPPSEMTLSPE